MTAAARRRSPEDVGAAKARLIAWTGPSGGTGRTAGRRLGPLPIATKTTDTALLALAADPGRLSGVLTRATAVRLAQRIATTIDAMGRAEIAEVIDNDTRRFAVQHRKLAPPAEEGPPFDQAFTAARARIMAAFADRLGPDLLPRLGLSRPDVDPGPGDIACLDAALGADTQ